MILKLGYQLPWVFGQKVIEEGRAKHFRRIQEGRKREQGQSGLFAIE